MFRRRLTIAFSVLAVLAVLQGVGSVLALSDANQRVLRGRVASDIKLGFVELSVTKQRLRAWVSQAQLYGGAEPVERDRLFAELNLTLDKLRELSRMAIALDDGNATDPEHGQRQEALDVLTRSFTTLRQSISSLQPLQPGTDVREAWRSNQQMFDVSNGRDLRGLIADSIKRESAAMQRERNGADEALGRTRALWTGMAITLVLAALALAAYFTRALRQPLDQLTEGAKALQHGELTHRIPDSGGDEFATVARSVNAMAAELAEHRQREVEERQRLEELVQARTADLESALEALKKVDERRRQLFADISHELRTPTTAIRGEAEITLRGRDKSSDEYKAALQRIVETSVQLAVVIEDLLTMARSDIDALALNRRPVDLSEPLSDALSVASAMGKERGIVVEAEPLPPGALPVLGDAQRLRQLMMLLLDNAVRYSRPGGRVQVQLTRRDLPNQPARAELMVRDQGIGIAADELSQVFQRNFRGRNARQHRADGTGLGLSIGAALVRAHNGEISVDSQLGEGTVVIVRLPLLQEKSALSA